ncbi:MAG: hypothetical protein D6689_07360 [Deltaproteobacteria bacterium]|nr:MAG: hypothetical protein D6689_07360 [Deltaproteobacteria bacterium]
MAAHNRRNHAAPARATCYAIEMPTLRIAIAGLAALIASWTATAPVAAPAAGDVDPVAAVTAPSGALAPIDGAPLPAADDLDGSADDVAPHRIALPAPPAAAAPHAPAVVRRPPRAVLRVPVPPPIARAG